MIQAVIFDFDGVLFNSEQFHFQTLQQILKQELGVKMSMADFIENYFGKDDLSIFRDVLLSQGLDANIKRIRTLIQAKIMAYQQSLHDNVALPAIEGVGYFLEYLSEKRIPVAVFSNGNREEVLFALERLDGGRIKPHFEFVTTIDDVGCGKPEPEGYLLSAEKLKVNSADCLVIEDSINGIRAGKAAGMTVVGLTTTHQPGVLDQYADFVVGSYAELHNYFKIKNLRISTC